MTDIPEACFTLARPTRYGLSTPTLTRFLLPGGWLHFHPR